MPPSCWKATAPSLNSKDRLPSSTLRSNALLHKTIPFFTGQAKKGTMEVDLVLQRGQGAIPIEVKAEENLKVKNLRVYIEQFVSEQEVWFSMAAYRGGGSMVSVPLHAVNFI